MFHNFQHIVLAEGAHANLRVDLMTVLLHIHLFKSIVILM